MFHPPAFGAFGSVTAWRRRRKRLKELEERVAAEGCVLTESQLQALKAAKEEKQAHGEIETEHPGYLGSQDTFYVGSMEGVGRIYQQTFVDTYSRVAFCKLYTMKTPVTAADLLNDRVLPFFEGEDTLAADPDGPRNGVLRERRTSRVPALPGVGSDHTKTKTKSPQTNGICERFHKTVLEEFYQVQLRKKIYSSVDELQADLDAWLIEYNQNRPHQGKRCDGKTPYETFVQAKEIVEDKRLTA